MERKTILIIDDESSITELMRIHLEEQGYEVCVAYNGMDAIEKIKQKMPDLITLDLMLPDIDGLSLLRFFQEKEQIKDIPIIIISIYGDERNIIDNNVNIVNIMPKPIDFSKLHEYIKQTLS